MKILIEDGLTIGRRPTGIGQYTLGVYRAARTHLESLQAPNGIEVLLNRHRIFDRVPRGIIRRLFYLAWLNSLAEAALWARGIDKVHYTAHYTGFVRYPGPVRIFTIHDLTPWKVRKSLPPHLGPVPKLVIRLAVETAAAIITPTVTVKREVVDTFGVDPARVFACCYYGGGDRTIQGRPPAPDGLGRFFLFVGTLERRKNIPTLIRAFAAVRQRAGLGDLRLVLIGRRGYGFEEIEMAVADEAVRDAIWMPGYVRNDELGALYANAAAFVMPSLYEGFGIPVVEAMAHAAPVVASDIPALREVASDAALFYGRPTDAPALCEALERILDDALLRDGLRARGRANAARFTSARVARDHLHVYLKARKA